MMTHVVGRTLPSAVLQGPSANPEQEGGWSEGLSLPGCVTCWAVKDLRGLNQGGFWAL